MSLHITPLRHYIGVFLALMVLTFLTVWVSTVHLGDPWNDVAAMAIAVLKATLVVLIFMHVRHSTRLTKLVVVSGFLWLLILFAFTLSDYLTRDQLGPGVFGK